MCSDRVQRVFLFIFISCIVGLFCENSTIHFLRELKHSSVVDCFFGVFYSRFFHSWWLHHCRWRVANLDLYSALMANEQWWFFIEPHLPWHGTFVYKVISEDLWNSHLLPSIYRFRSVAVLWDSNPDLENVRRTLYQLNQRSDRWK